MVGVRRDDADQARVHTQHLCRDQAQRGGHAGDIHRAHNDVKRSIGVRPHAGRGRLHPAGPAADGHAVPDAVAPDPVLPLGVVVQHLEHLPQP